MNKRLIIGLVSSFIIIVGGYIGVREYLSYKEISFIFKQPDVSVDIYSSNNSKVSSNLTSDTTLQLKDGTYFYIPLEERYSDDKVYFSVTKDETVEISPSYSSDFLKTLLKQEQGRIRQTLLSTYPSISTDYIVGDELLSHWGEWYSAKLAQRVSGGNQPDIYRIILKNNASNWSIAVSPRLIVSEQEFPNIPDYVIRQVNEPLSNAAYALLYPE